MVDQMNPKERSTKPPLVDRIIQCGKLAFDPSVPIESRLRDQEKFDELLKNTGTVALLPVLNHLVQPERVPAWLRTPLIQALALLPLRPLGVQHTIEFVLSVHPSNANFNAPVKAGRGSGLSHEALNAASRLLSSPPAGMKPEVWFSSLAPQLFQLLDGKGEPEMDRAAAFIIGFGILGRRQYGAPGMPGWQAFAEPLLGSIDPSVGSINLGNNNTSINKEYDDIGTVSRESIIVSSTDLGLAVSRLYKLVTFHPNPSLSQRLLRPIILPLWSLSSWQNGNEATEKSYCKPARQLLRSLLLLSSSKDPSSDKSNSKTTYSNNLLLISQHLIYEGRDDSESGNWIYTMDQSGGIQVETSGGHAKPSVYHDLAKVDKVVSSFTELLKSLPESGEVSNIFLHLYRRWLERGKKNQTSSVIMPFELGKKEDDNFIQEIINAKLMQQMITDFQDRLVQDSTQVLEIVSESLDEVNNPKGEITYNEESFTISLSLLNIILTSPSFNPTSTSLLGSIERSLEKIGNLKDLEASSTARNLLLLLRFRDTLDKNESQASIPIIDKHTESRKTYKLALSYLTSTESPPPVKVQGLELLSDLIREGSPVLDIPALVVLFSSLVQDDDEYIYLRAIRSFIQLSARHPRTVLSDLIDRYLDPQEELGLDTRLRFGETLIQVIQNVASHFTGDIARTVSETLLAIAGRRGYRPRTQLEQERQQKLKEMQNKEAEDAWDGEVPQLDEVLPDEFGSENEVLAQIVAGWEGKRGSEDVRIRASALAVLGAGIEANVSGVGSRLIAASVDLCVHILTLERDPEFGILRRSAILLVMSLVRALDAAREAQKSVGFGFVGQSLEDIIRILTYVSETDNDGLVRQHAKDVIEGLGALQMNTLVSQSQPRTGIETLAGLSINPEPTRRDAPRPRIEEIE